MYKILVLLSLIVACSKDAKEVKNTNNTNFEVELLFTHEGCKVYLFYDARTIYYTNCSQTMYNVNCGKNCTRNEIVKTNHDLE